MTSGATPNTSTPATGPGEAGILEQWCPMAPLLRHPPGRIVSPMKKPTCYTVIAIDPDAEWRCLPVVVHAHSKAEAKRCARGELARTKQDHWSLSYVLEGA